ncbi:MULTISPECIES: DUF6292 family protein [Actinokineospora]|uniref:DUF6292 domain-containing protein n=1 Tax=Actinokineospora fastidiosa TaxID=1816 RepID=A0A918GIV3_9PSEU|nr:MULTISPECIES: DUF6292 family protein [Actinokineospora]UVS80467.1 hypothetical protein Actkin_04218 [Actinokineospora sp. UTMC 2448]GGS35545.1 hypothetical protein GCM10010171_32650 [Actinokineospora fastidiosa]
MVKVDFDDLVVRGLHGYVREVTERLGLSGECSYVQAEPLGVYLALDGRLPGYPDRDVALLWDDERGWAAAVETHSGEDLLVQAWFGHDLLPAPHKVARWVRGLFDGRLQQPRLVSPRRPQEDLAARLAPYAVDALMPLPRLA